MNKLLTNFNCYKLTVLIFHWLWKMDKRQKSVTFFCCLHGLLRSSWIDLINCNGIVKDTIYVWRVNYSINICHICHAYKPKPTLCFRDLGKHNLVSWFGFRLVPILAKTTNPAHFRCGQKSYKNNRQTTLPGFSLHPEIAWRLFICNFVWFNVISLFRIRLWLKKRKQFRCKSVSGGLRKTEGRIHFYR